MKFMSSPKGNTHFWIFFCVVGPPNSGKTALAAQIARNSEFPFLKICSPETMVGFHEAAKCLAIKKVLLDVECSSRNLIAIDELERILYHKCWILSAFQLLLRITEQIFFSVDLWRRVQIITELCNSGWYWKTLRLRSHWTSFLKSGTTGVTGATQEITSSSTFLFFFYHNAVRALQKNPVDTTIYKLEYV